MFAEVNASHTQLLKSEFGGPLSNFLRQRLQFL